MKSQRSESVCYLSLTLIISVPCSKQHQDQSKSQVHRTHQSTISNNKYSSRTLHNITRQFLRYLHRHDSEESWYTSTTPLASCYNTTPPTSSPRMFGTDLGLLVSQSCSLRPKGTSSLRGTASEDSQAYFPDFYVEVPPDFHLHNCFHCQNQELPALGIGR